jgi:hypothetical protein
MELLVFVWDQLKIHLSAGDWFLLSINSLLLVFSRPIVAKIDEAAEAEGKSSRALFVFQAINALVILLVLFNSFYQSLSSQTIFSKIIGTLLIIYMGYLFYHLSGLLIRHRYGKKRTVNDETVISETYSSRALSLLVSILLFIVGLIAVVQLWGFIGLLEAGGVVGFFGVMLALTQAAWAPDIISGLIILNSKLVEEGDVIELNEAGKTIMGVVFRTKVFHTEILNFVNNHRIVVKNSKLREYTIHNLSRFASAKGLRELLTFKIGYEVLGVNVEQMFQDVFELAIADADIDISDQHEIEVRVLSTGDYAVTWGFFYYTKETKTLLATRQKLTRLILDESIKRNIRLATPVLHQSAEA